MTGSHGPRSFGASWRTSWPRNTFSPCATLGVGTGPRATNASWTGARRGLGRAWGMTCRVFFSGWTKKRNGCGSWCFNLTHTQMTMGQNLWRSHFGADEHPCTTYLEVHQRYKVLTHSQMTREKRSKCGFRPQKNEGHTALQVAPGLEKKGI